MFCLLFLYLFTFVTHSVSQPEDYVTKEELAVLQNSIRLLESKVQSLEVQLKAKQDRTPLFSFRAGFSSDPVPVKYSNGQDVVFDRVYYNDGNAYIAHTGKFLTQVSGLYVFTLHVLPASAEMEFEIFKAGRAVASVVATSSGGTESIQTVMHVTRGEEVWVVKHWGGDTLRGSLWTSFSGFLLRSDEDSPLNGGSGVVG